VPVRQPASPAGVVLVLHGGATRGPQVPVDARQLSVLRMIPTARAVARASRRLSVHRLLNTYRGWDEAHTPLQDTVWALDQLRSRHPGVPVGLVGHSLGGRTALLAAAQPDVRSVVALNPWVYPTDDPDLSGRRVLIVHGTDDRVASIEKARTVARNLSRTTSVEFVEIEGGKHAMLSHGREFDRRAAEFTASALLSRV
jgi:alpha-beta hydrolase superfamily lysophospholipase